MSPRPGVELIPTKFFEDFPLYAEMEYQERGEKSVGNGAIPAIRMECLVCKSDQTSVLKTHGYEDGLKSDYRPEGVRNAPLAGRIAFVVMSCAACDKFKLNYVIRFGADGKTIQKVGQFPGPSIRISKDLERLLGDNRDYYKRGRISENQGYGIGAFAYYRRVVESLIDDLLHRIGDLLPSDKKAEFSAALDRVKDSRVAQDKIDLVKNLLPDSLRPGGRNPLGILHSALSEGLHSLDEEECLDNAMSIRHVLEFLIAQVTAEEAAKRTTFTTGMEKLLKKKNPPKEEAES
jgi:hypothetical protein